MTTKLLHTKMQKGYDDIEAGNVQNAKSAFEKFRESLNMKQYTVEITDEALIVMILNLD